VKTIQEESPPNRRRAREVVARPVILLFRPFDYDHDSSEDFDGYDILGGPDACWIDDGGRTPGWRSKYYVQ
jgi:hypothetical protein